MKRTKLTYTLECPGYWWSSKKHIWFILTDESSKDYLPFSSCRIFRTKNKAMSALDNIRHIKGSFVDQELHTKKGHYLLRTWTNK